MSSEKEDQLRQPSDVQNENFVEKSLDKTNEILGITQLTEKENREHFEQYLVYAKGGLLVFLLLVTAIYQIYFIAMYDVQNPNKRALNHTYLNDSRTIGSVFADAFINGAFGVISSMIINISRYSSTEGIGSSIMRGLKNDKGEFTVFNTYLIVFVILTAFTICEEGSGFNRYLATPDEYVERDGQNTENLINQNTGGNPFLMSVAYVGMLFMFVFVAFFILRMFATTWHSYKIEKKYHLISDIFGFINSRFALELLILIVLNGCSPLISIAIRGEKLKGSSFVTVAMFVVVVFCLHYMLQYNGFLGQCKGFFEKAEVLKAKTI